LGRTLINGGGKISWQVTGAIPLGYEPDGRTLKIVPEEAATVRALYDLYLRHRSIMAVVEHANRLGLCGKVKVRKAKKQQKEEVAAKAGAEVDAEGAALRPDHSTHCDRTACRVPFERAALHYLLTNPVYAGRIRHRDVVHEGQHPAIIDPDTWEQVQALLKEAASRKRGQGRGGISASPLAGKLVDETGDKLTPSHANKKGKRYRYYVSTRLIGKEGRGGARIDGGWRLPAKALEDQVASAVKIHLRNRLPADLITAPSTDAISRIGSSLDLFDGPSRANDLTVFLSCIEQATIKRGAIDIVLNPEMLAETIEISEDDLTPEALSFNLPFQFRKRGIETKLVIGNGHAKELDETLIRNIAKAHQFYEAIKQGQTFEEIAASENLSKRRILQVIDLAFLAPDIVKSIVLGDHPVGLTAKRLGQHPLPSNWQAQRRIVATL
jgi:site-specific DNA recombinase